VYLYPTHLNFSVLIISSTAAFACHAAAKIHSSDFLLTVNVTQTNQDCLYFQVVLREVSGSYSSILQICHILTAGQPATLSGISRISFGDQKLPEIRKSYCKSPIVTFHNG
jgi:hypothetical protein